MEKIPKHEPSIENYNDEEVFQSYIEDLKLSPEDFDKKILDVGSGSGQFAKWAKEHNISSQIFSLDPREEPQEKTKSVKAVAEAIPFRNEVFDLVISNAAIPNIYTVEESQEITKEKVKNSLFEMMRVTKPGGEIRLGRVLKGEISEMHKAIVSALDETLNELRQIYGAEIEEIPYPAADAYKYKNDKPTELVARGYLIKIHKPQTHKINK